MAANDPPKDKEPVSPRFCWRALYQRKPKQAPTIDPQKIDSSPTFGIYCIWRYSEKIVFPTTYEIKVNDKATSITGTVAKPFNPSVKLTALDAPIITNKARDKK